MKKRTKKAKATGIYNCRAGASTTRRRPGADCSDYMVTVILKKQMLIAATDEDAARQEALWALREMGLEDEFDLVKRDEDGEWEADGDDVIGIRADLVCND
jgi:hypothetical protein